MNKTDNNYMNGKQKRLQDLLSSICCKFEEYTDPPYDIQDLLHKINSLRIDLDPTTFKKKKQDKRNALLRKVIPQSTDPKIHNILNKLNKAIADLTWKRDSHQFYSKSENLGAAYRKFNLHCQIIGPRGDLVRTSEFMLGIFMLAPWTLYKDHSHLAPELYLNLSEKSSWRFNFGDWQDLRAGSVVWNPSKQIHATKVLEKPFLAVFVWLKDINCLCKVEYSKDHTEIEKELLRQRLMQND